tara:strand:- start:3080 stop:3625 length:546 start_codon:yes stop_codon:yes gene_type:complete
MRRLLAALVFIVGCHDDPPSTLYDHERLAEPSTQLPLVVTRIEREYDAYRSDRHDIPIYIARLIRENARAQDIPLGLAFALVKLESGFVPWAVSHAGAIGLSQVMPPTGLEHCGLTENQLYDPARNLLCGFGYLRMLHDRHGDWSVALAAYNVGDARRARAWRTGEPDGARYAARIIEDAS